MAKLCCLQSRPMRCLRFAGLPDLTRLGVVPKWGKPPNWTVSVRFPLGFASASWVCFPSVSIRFEAFGFASFSLSLGAQDTKYEGLEPAKASLFEVLGS